MTDPRIPRPRRADRRNERADDARRWDALLDGQAEDSELGAALSAASRPIEQAGTDGTDGTDGMAGIDGTRGVDAATAAFRAANSRRRRGLPAQRRRARIVRAVGTVTLATKLMIGGVAAAAVGGITYVSVEHHRHAPPSRTSPAPGPSQRPSSGGSGPSGSPGPSSPTPSATDTQSGTGGPSGSAPRSTSTTPSSSPPSSATSSGSASGTSSASSTPSTSGRPSRRPPR